MPADLTQRDAMLSLLSRIVDSGPLNPKLRMAALETLAAIARSSEGGSDLPPALLQAHSAAESDSAAAASFAAPTAPPVGNRRLIYVHGICHHSRGFSDSWWAALRPYVGDIFEAGALGHTRLEVIWSDLVNRASAQTAMDAATADGGAALHAAASHAPLIATDPTDAVTTEAARQLAADEIKEALRDRADQQVLAIASSSATDSAAIPMSAGAQSDFISIPGFNCVDDFAVYLTNNDRRQEILGRFLEVVRPELKQNHELDIVSHSWGTVVAYEGLRALEREQLATPRVRNLFTVGSALSIGPVKLRLLPENKDGKKPANVRRWVNLDAKGDIVGGALQGRPYEVDFDFVNLNPHGCGDFFGLIDPRCAHSSYFLEGNRTVNQQIFARYIEES